MRFNPNVARLLGGLFAIPTLVGVLYVASVLPVGFGTLHARSLGGSLRSSAWA